MAQAERTLQLNPNHAVYVASLAWQIGMVGEGQSGLKLMDKAMCLTLSAGHRL